MKYESEGLFIGLVSFPFYKDGNNLLRDVFRPFFDNHRKYLNKICRGASEDYYSPTAYRMLGKSGLAIFSLIDDYAFPSRVFNIGHLDQNNAYKDASECKATVLTGSTESNGSPYLLPRSQKTFLATENRYPFVGIIRIKVKCKLLEGRGAGLTRDIKEKIEELKKEIAGETGEIQIIITDSYDNDELIVSSFSTSFHKLYQLSEAIKKQEVKDVRIEGSDSPSPCGHIFEACHEDYGVHSEFNMEGEPHNFREWDKSNDTSGFEVNMLVEAKPGHRDYFAGAFDEKYTSRKTAPKPRVTITGGGLLFYSLPVTDIPWIYNVTGEAWFRHNAARVKLTFSRIENKTDDIAPAEHDSQGNDNSKYFIDVDFINEVRESLKKLGVSKTIRERVLSLFRLYNYCCKSRVQSYYFEKLKEPVENIGKIIKSFSDDADIPLGEIERVLNEEVTSLKTAFSDRVNTMTQNEILEYGCGIQQILQGFGTAYQTICNVLDQDQDPKYSFVVAKSKECSTETHIELNINHIIYPDLFVTTVWKEASNFSYEEIGHWLELDAQQGSARQSPAFHIFKDFYAFINNRKAQDHVMSIIYSELMQDIDDETNLQILNILEKEDSLNFIKYILSDATVYHFAFQHDLQTMWESYFKAFLQMSSNYSRLGKPLMKPLVFLLLRLFMVALSESDDAKYDANLTFITKQLLRPFDPILSNLWHLCYLKTFKCSKRIFDEWQKYNYCGAVERMDYMYDLYALGANATEDGIKSLRTKRTETILEYKTKIATNEALNLNADGEMSSKEKIICILNAFTQAIHDLGYRPDAVFHRLLRNPGNGDIWFDKYIDDSILPKSAGILADQDGGLFVPNQEDRKKYFAYRTWLYRTLWDFSYTIRTKK